MQRKLLFIGIFLITIQLLGQNHTANANQISASANYLGITHGIHIRPTEEYGKEIIAFDNLVDKKTGLIMFSLDWSRSGRDENNNIVFINGYLLSKLRGSFPDTSSRPAILLTWIPKEGRETLQGLPACNKDYDGAVPFDDIVRGICDDYLRGVAQAIKNYSDFRFLLRFAHEMNIQAVSYWPGWFDDVTPHTFIEAWHHIHSIFQQEDVSNIEWVWSPNYQSYPEYVWNAIYNYYPGNRYVDWIALSGFNWYTEFTPTLQWKWFSDIYAEILKDLACKYPKPQILAAISSVEGSGDLTKSFWINDAFEQLPAYPFVRAITWFNDYAFNDPNEADFRITTSTAQYDPTSSIPMVYSLNNWTTSYADAISDPIYKETLLGLDLVTPPLQYCGSGESILSGPHSRLAQRGTVIQQTLIGMLYEDSLTISADLPPGFSLENAPQLNPPWDVSVAILNVSDEVTPGSYKIVFTAGELPPFTMTVQVLDELYRNFLSIVHKES